MNAAETQCGHFLREWRQQTNMAQKDVAQGSGVSMSNYNYIEAGKVGYTQKTLSALAQFYGVDPGDLLCVDPSADETDDIDYLSLKVIAGRMSTASRAEAGSLLAMVSRIDGTDRPADAPSLAGRPSCGHFLKEWRAYTRMNQAEFAEAVESSHSSYNYLESGKVSYSQASLVPIARFLRVRPGDIISLNPLTGLRHDPAFLHGWDTYRRLSQRGRHMASELFRQVYSFDKMASLSAVEAASAADPQDYPAMR